MEMFKKIMVFPMLCFLLWGCIREDRSDCGKLRMRFRYTQNDSGQDRLADETGDIRVYAFDSQTGLLAGVIDVDKDAIRRGWLDVKLPDGKYTFVSWGASGDDIMRGGYQTQTVVGVTTLDDFRMMLAYTPAPAGQGDTGAIPATPDFDHLFYASVSDFEVAGSRMQTVDFDFIKNTSTLKVIVTGLDHLTHPSQGLPLDIFTTGRNYLYGSDNGLDASTPRMLYLPYDATADGDTQVVYIRQQRLSIAQSATEPVMLYIRSADGGQDMILPLNLVDLIRQNPAYPDQAAIDREDMFVIELSILLDLRVTVTVNGWEIVLLYPDIDW